MNNTGAPIPVIDISGLPADTKALAAVDAACREWGLFQVVGHGLDPAMVAGILYQARLFFHLPSVEKRKVERSQTNSWGFYDRELTKNTRDWKEIFDVGPASTDGPLAGSQPQWPAGREDFRRIILSYYAACETVASRLLAAISLNLGMAENFLQQEFIKDQTSFLRLNYYPRCELPAAAATPGLPATGYLGINSHSDSGALTVLAQDPTAALQVRHRGGWHLVEPLAGALTINIGDIVQVWSNDEYVAPLHRVLANAHIERFSVPFFYNPSYNTIYQPLAGMCSQLMPPRYRAINWGEFRAGRSAGDYADHGEEIQISHFRYGSN